MNEIDDASERIAEIAGVFSDPTRIRIITLLSNNKNGLTTMGIATHLDILQPRISSHLAILLKYRLISVETRGRQRIYTLNSKKTVPILRDIASISSPDQTEKISTAPRSARQTASYSMRQCRSCYDHLAGVAGVNLLDEIMKAGWLSVTSRKQDRKTGKKVFYRITESGSKSLRERGVDVGRAQESSRTFAYGCLDWTERRPHLGGALGKAILDSLFARGIVERMNGTRALKLVEPISGSWTPAI